jgi:hypothetical protein
MITIFSDFHQFLAGKKSAFFLEKQCDDYFFTGSVLNTKTPIFVNFLPIFWRKFFLNHNIGPRFQKDFDDYGCR